MNENYILRKADENDKEAILSLFHSMIGTEGCTWNLDYPGMLEIDEDMENGSLYCLCSGNSIVATAFTGYSDELISLKWNDKIHKPCDLARICVRRDMQNKGLGKLLLTLLFDDAKSAVLTVCVCWSARKTLLRLRFITNAVLPAAVKQRCMALTFIVTNACFKAEP